MGRSLTRMSYECRGRHIFLGCTVVFVFLANVLFGYKPWISHAVGPRHALARCHPSFIPVVVVAHNNPTLLSLLVAQLRQCYNASVIVLDMASTYKPMLDYLDRAVNDNGVQVWRHHNATDGPRVLFEEAGRHFYQRLPRFFALTDADLRLNDFMPTTFLCDLARLTQHLQYPKAGVALDITDYSRMWDSNVYAFGHSIKGWESQLYRHKKDASVLRIPGHIWEADIDTTLAVYDKLQHECIPGSLGSCFTYKALRVTGAFVAKHRPWYPEVISALKEDEFDAVFTKNPHSFVHRLLKSKNISRSSSTLHALASASKKQSTPLDVDNLLDFSCSSI